MSPEFSMNSLSAVMLGTLTAVGGGTLRDVLLNEVPAVLRVDVYAAAALSGAIVTIFAVQHRVRLAVAMACGAGVCFAIRLGAIVGHWNLPRAT